MRSAAEILQSLPTSPETGLTSAGVEQSRSRYGSNLLTPLPREPVWKKFLEKFDEPIIKILLAAALLSTVVDLFNYSGTSWGAVGLVLVVGVVASGFIVGKLKPWLPSMLFGTAIVLFLLSLAASHPSYEGLAIMIAVGLATGVAFASELKSDREFEVLNAQKEAIQVKVIRDGEFHTIPLDEVVVGDLVVLGVGDEIPADGRLLKATDLAVDQSLMTGESEPVHKHAQPLEANEIGPDKPGCLYRGTQVVDGVGQMLVAEVGDATMIGQIARRLSAEGEPDTPSDGPETEEQRVQRKLTISKQLTPLQLKLQHLAELISKVGYIAAVAIFSVLLVRGLILGELRLTPTYYVSAESGTFLKDERGELIQDAGKAQAISQATEQTAVLESTAQAIIASAGKLLDYFVYMVIIIVVAVPEGLPMSVTVSLALAMQKMTRANSLVRQLVACETIGSATVICSDKTGTLTQNKMQVVRLAYDGLTFDKGNPDWPKPDRLEQWPDHPKPIDWLALNAAVNSTANLENKDGKLVTVGNSTEGSLLLWLHENGCEYEKLRLAYPALYQIHFSSERKRMTTVVEAGGGLVALVKGASEVVLERTQKYLSRDGSEHAWHPELRQRISQQILEAAGDAMRTLGFAYAKLPPGTPRDENSLSTLREQLETELVFVGFVAIRDPLRDDVKDAVQQCRDAGIEVKMITGDNVETARAIARDIGLLDRPDSVVLTHEEFVAKSDEELKELLPRMRVLARAQPLDKYRMVKLLQDQGHVVAMTGDGTNDAPSLKRADVGLAMGIAGTEVAKDASKIVLLDDSFATIVKAVMWGRSLYENIQRFVQFQLTINVSALLIAFIGPFLGVRPPFTVLQLLWINVIMDTFAAIALCSEPPRREIMKQKPKRRDENIITRRMAITIFSTAGFYIVVMLGILLAMEGGWLASGEPVPASYQPWGFEPLDVRQVSLFFTTYVLFQVWNLINCRSLTPMTSGLVGLHRNPFFLGIAGAILIGQLLIVNFGGTIFKTQPLGVMDWVWMLLGTSTVLIFAEIARQIRKRAELQPQAG